jgi:hypothetical protein
VTSRPGITSRFATGHQLHARYISGERAEPRNVLTALNLCGRRIIDATGHGMLPRLLDCASGGKSGCLLLAEQT